MRVLNLISSSSFAGAEAAVASLSSGLRRIGCDPVVGTIQNPHIVNTGVEERLEEMGIRVEMIPCRGRLDRSCLRRIEEWLRRNAIDVLHTHGYKADLYGSIAARTGGMALVATCHNWTCEGLLGTAYDLVDRMALRRFTGIAAVSKPVRQTLLRFGLPAARVRVIPNGVDIRAFTDRSSTFAAKLGKNGAIAVGYVGRLVVDKGVDLLLHSAPAVLRAHRETLFVIVGEGPARPDLEILAQTLGISSNVRFVGHQTDMPAVYGGLDIVALPSRNEGAPMTVIEAMASALPVVATGVGALPEVVIDGKTGVLVQPNDSSSIASALIALISDRHRCVQMGLNGRRRAMDLFSCESMARQYVSLYESALRLEPVC